MVVPPVQPVLHTFVSSSVQHFIDSPSAVSSNGATSSVSTSLSDAGVGQKWDRTQQQHLHQQPLSPATTPSTTMSRTRSPSNTSTKLVSNNTQRHRRATSVSSSSHQNPPDIPPSSFSHSSVRPGLPYSLSANSSDPSLKPRKESSSKVRPFLRKLTSTDSAANSLDLSRSAADQDSGGLGIYSSAQPSPDPTVNEISFSPVSKRGYHARSTSGTSQYSTSSLQQRAGYPAPFRTNPRPYTPPVPSSYAPSVIGSEYSGEAYDEADVRTRLKRARTHSSPSTPPPHPPTLRIQTSSSRLGQTSNISPSKMGPGTPKGGIGFKIRKTDPISQANTIQAAREAFDAREREKAIKAEKEALKESEKLERRRERSESKSKSKTPKIKSNTLDGGFSEKAPGHGGGVVGGREYSTLQNPTELPQTRPHLAPPPRRTTNRPPKSGNAWVRFVLWLKLRVMNMKRKIGM